MTTLDRPDLALLTVADPDTPRQIDPGYSTSDKVFRGTSRSIGGLVLAITGSIGLFLGWQAVPTIHKYGLGFFTKSGWAPVQGRFGIASVLVDTFEVGLLAMAVAFPLALCVALFITDYAPARLRGLLVALVDLMAAVPSIIWGLLVRDFLSTHLVNVAHWISTYFGWIFLFKVSTDPHAGQLARIKYAQSAFIASIAVAAMVLPMACSVMREVFSQTPVGEREATLALGGTRWGVVRTVVLPFGRGGIVGGAMLALGRALGETISVVLILSPAYVINGHVLENGAQTISALIAGNFSEATHAQLSALLCAGFVLFLITLLINTLASIVVNRGRSGAATEL